MNPKVFPAITGLLCSSILGFAQQPSNQNQQPPKLGLHWARGENPQGETSTLTTNGKAAAPNMIYHGGPIMTSTVVTPIFWGTSWTKPGDKIRGINTFYAGIGGSEYLRTNDEYTQKNGTHVRSAVTASRALVDLSKAVGGNNTPAILGEVCRVLKNHGITPKANGYYPVYTDVPRGGNGYCAYHSAGSCGGVTVQFGFFWKLDGDAGCDPHSSVTGQSEGLQALANVSGHELSETVTDRYGNAWFDSKGNENSDKCAWSFGSDFVRFKNGSRWQIQGNWSNYAFTHHVGYTNNIDQRGCLDGGDYKIGTGIAPF
jgi:hypothetical protein